MFTPPGWFDFGVIKLTVWPMMYAWPSKQPLFNEGKVSMLL